MRLAEEIELSFVLPCLNELATIGACVEECWEAIREAGIEGEVVVADNGSEDGSDGIAEKAGARVVRVASRGYGSAIMAGVREARGRYVIVGDSDMSYDFREAPGFLERLRAGDNFVIGCRMPRGGGCIEKGAMPFLHRWVGNPVLSWVGRFLFKTNVRDFHCGIRAFDRERLLALNLVTPGMEFASEMVVKAEMAGLRIGEVPVTLRVDGRERRPHLQTWRDGWRHLRFMLLHCPRWLVLYPGMGITVLALIGFIRLLIGPVTIGGASFETNTLLIAKVGVLLGVQVMLLGCVAEVYRAKHGLRAGGEPGGSAWLDRAFEKGLLVGAVFLGVAFTCFLFALPRWRAVGFGDLVDFGTRRFVVVGVMCGVLGLQIIFSGCVVGVMNAFERESETGGSKSGTPQPGEGRTS